MKRESAVAVRVVVVIPAYNEAATIAGVVRRAAAHAASVIVVDDGSRDGTAAALDGLPCAVIVHPRNLGKGAALARGMAEALAQGAGVVITLDADGQHAPEEIPRLVRAAAAHPDAVIIGARLRRTERAPRHRRIANRVADFFIGWAAGQRIDDTQSGFRLYPAALLPRLEVPSGPDRGFVFESELLIEAARAGVPIRSVAIDSIYASGARPSHFRPVTDIARIGRMLFWKLAPRGFDPVGLVRSLSRRERSRSAAPEETV
jgi:glycosyltransferase involved in cell wall biosynthesis